MSPLRDFTVLVAPDATELRDALLERGFQVSNWPTRVVQQVENSAELDEAIENLFGYDWVVFVNDDAVRFFVERLRARGQDVSELDSLRVCAIGEETAAALEQSRIHVDVIATSFTAAHVADNIATYVGGHNSLRRLNFLVPQAAIGRDYLKDELEETGARADVVAAYQSVANADYTRLVALQTLLRTRSIDGVVFTRASEIGDLARVLDTNDLGKVLKETVVFATDEISGAADIFGITQPIRISSDSATVVADLVKHFS